MRKFEIMLSNILYGTVKRRSCYNSELISKAKRVLGKASEVIVKISGNTKGSSHVKTHLDYISRNGKLILENERGEILQGKENVVSLHKEWVEDCGKRRINGQTRDTTNLVLSMPAGTESHTVKESARDFAKKTFGKNYQYVFSLHMDANNPHIHLSVKNLGYNGKRLHIKKGDPQVWRENFAFELQKRGINAEATPRAVRGVIRKGIRQAIKHIREKGLKPKTDNAKIREIAKDFSNLYLGKTKNLKPWEIKIVKRQISIRKGWLMVAQELNSSNKADERELAIAIVVFVKNMPPMATGAPLNMSNAVVTATKRKYSLAG